MSIIPCLNVGAGILSGAFILYVSSLWVLLFFNKKKLVSNICSSESMFALSIYNVLSIAIVILDTIIDEGMHKLYMITVMDLIFIALVLLFIIFGLSSMAIVHIRSKFIDT